MVKKRKTPRKRTSQASQPAGTGKSRRQSNPAARPRKLIGLLCLLTLVALVAVFWLPKPQPVAARLPDQGPTDRFATADACRECHAGEYDSWHDSFHRSMTQVVSSDNVIAPFNDVHLESRGRPVHLTQKNGKFWAELGDPDEDFLRARGFSDQRGKLPAVKREVVMSTGSHHYQTYWINGLRGNQLFQVPWVYLVEDQRWIPAEDAFIRPLDYPHRIAIWNSGCIQCHAVGGNPGIDRENASYESTIVDFGIACEACHGPGQSHIDLHRNQPVDPAAEDPIVNPADLDHQRSSEICGQCHSSYEYKYTYQLEGRRFVPGNDLSVHVDLLNYESKMVQEDPIQKTGYWKDGTMRVAGRDFTAMRESACYLNGEISCTSCHSMHGFDQPADQLTPHQDPNHSCVQCHDTIGADISAHTHHELQSSGSTCYNCHMPHTSFGLMKAIRSHRIDSPSAQNTHDTKRPNACNLCHLDQTLDWSGRWLADWYGQPALDTSDANDQSTASSLSHLLRGDAVERAVLAWSFDWKEAQETTGIAWQIPFLAQLLKDPYPVVRFVAHKSIRTYPGYEDFQFDFLGQPDQLEAASDQLVKMWLPRFRASNPSNDQELGKLLLNPDGTFTELMGKLLSERDDTPVFLPE